MSGYTYSNKFTLNNIPKTWLLAPLMLAGFAGPVPAQDENTNIGVVCSIDQTTIDGEDVDDDLLSPEELLVLEITQPSQGTPPSDTGELPGGGQGAFWDSNATSSCTHISADSTSTSGFCGPTRAIIENGTAQDALANDAIGCQTSLDEGTINRCGFRIADEDGLTWDTADWPEAIDFAAFTQGECFAVATSEANGAEVIALANNHFSYRYSKEGNPILEIFYGDTLALIRAIQYVNSLKGNQVPEIEFIGAPKPFLFVDEGLPTITRPVKFISSATYQRSIGAPNQFRFMQVANGGDVTMNVRGQTLIEGFESNDGGGALRVDGTGRVLLRNIEFRDNRSDGDGGAVLVTQDGSIDVAGMKFINNSSAGNGGAAAVKDDGFFSLLNSEVSGNTAGLAGGAFWRGGTARLLVSGKSKLKNNTAGTNGGAIAISGEKQVGSEENPFHIPVTNSSFSENTAGGDGCDIYIDMSGAAVQGPRVYIERNSFGELCDKALISTNQTRVRLIFNTVRIGEEDVAVKMFGEGADAELFGNVIEVREPGQQLNAVSPAQKLQAGCEAGSAGLMTSLGYNVSSDDSCSLTEVTDLPNTDPMLSEPDENGIAAPLPGSPVIDIGPSGLVLLPDDEGPSLPCGWADLTGLGRPQDGDGDGGFECDSGAIEFQGAGAIEAGHSGAFFNSLRNGEGQYVEILDGGLAVIYTFTFRPDGTGSSWLLGIADVAGNSLVADHLNRPIGTPFGDAFDPQAIDFTEWGAMSMVFPDCDSAATPGNTVFSGSPELEYEPLVTRAERITNIAGCDLDEPPHANAGLSGSFYDPARNGEGLVIQWLPDGSVLAIMFTYDTNGQQVWIFGIGQSDGKTVTIDAVYPTGFTSWGSRFDSDEVVLSPWGTFTLTWSGCDTLVFDYASSVDGYGSATRNYSRLTSLWGLTCPDF